MNAIAKFRNEEVLNVDFICGESDIPMSAMERAKAKQAAIDSVPEHLLDAPVRAPFAKGRAERTTREKELFRLKIRAALTGDIPELSPALKRMKTVTPTLIRERQASPVKPEKKVSGWRSFFGKALSVVTDTVKSTQRFGKQLATAGLAAGVLMGAMPGTNTKQSEETLLAHNIIVEQADSVKRFSKKVEVKKDFKSWLSGSWAADYADSLNTNYENNGYGELPKVNNLDVNVFRVMADKHSGMGLLQALASQSPELDKIFNQNPKLRKVAYANVYKELNAQGLDANWLALGTRLSMTNGYVTLTDTHGKSYFAKMFPNV